MKKLLFGSLLVLGLIHAKAAHASVQGFLDVANCNQIAGWAWHTTISSPTATVMIYVDGAAVASAYADQYRPDLVAAGIGTGYYGFSISAPSVLQNGASHTVSASVDGVQLGTSPKTVKCSAASYQGYLDVINCDVIAGWAWNSSQPNSPINVLIVSSGSVSGMPPITASASNFRADLLAAGIGNGYHSYSIETPSALKDGNYHPIFVYAPDGTLLTNDSGEQTILCNQ